MCGIIRVCGMIEGDLCLPFFLDLHYITYTYFCSLRLSAAYFPCVTQRLLLCPQTRCETFHRLSQRRLIEGRIRASRHHACHPDYASVSMTLAGTRYVFPMIAIDSFQQRQPGIFADGVYVERRHSTPQVQTQAMAPSASVQKI